MSNNNFKLKVLFTLIVTSLAFLGAIFRIWYISRPGNIKLPQWRSYGLPKFRGTIMDRNGSYLALTVSSASIFLRPSKFKNKTKTIRLLARHCGLSTREIRRRISRGTPSFVWLKRQISRQSGEAIKKLKLPGVVVTSEPQRLYPYNSLAAHLLGFSGIDHVGLTGLEKGFDRILLPNQQRNKPAHNLVLTIDRFMQYIAEDELQKATTQYNAKQAMAIIYQPKTGEVLSMASVPSYNLNRFSQYRTARFVNPNTMLAYEPGSTFKIFTAIYLLLNKKASFRERFHCSGKIKLYKHTVKCTHAHGSVNLPDILKKSCNVGIIKLSKRINSRQFYAMLHAFGFGNPTKIGIPGESAGILNHPRNWSGISKAMMSIGYETSVTPIQLIRAAGAIANRGIMMQPHIIKAVTDWQGKIITSVAPTAIRQIMSPLIAHYITRMLRRVVLPGGTGSHANIPGKFIFGKTGTATIPKTNGRGYYKDRYNASFLGFLPYRKNKLVILVVIRQPKKAHLGGMTAAPVFNRIARRILQYLQKKSETNY